MGRGGKDRKGREGKGEGGEGKGKESSTWIFVQELQVPSYATASTTTLSVSFSKSRRHKRSFYSPFA